MRVRRSYLNWGIFLVCLGLIPLAIQLGYLDRSIAASVIRLWPIVLIGIGLGIMLRWTPFQLVGGVVVAAVAGLILGSLVGGGLRGATASCIPDHVAGAPITRTGSFEAGTADVDLEVTCAELNLDRQPVGEWRLDIDGGERPPVVTASGSRLSVATDETGLFVNEGRNWSVVLPEAPALALGLTMNASRATIDGAGALTRIGSTFNASEARIDLTGASTGSAFDGTLNASTVSVTLPSASLRGGITLNASSLTLCAPADLGLWITYTNTLGSENFSAAGLAGGGENWQTPDYGNAANQVALHITSNLSSINLDRSGGCQ